eukprot:scaffold107255_cov54-Phaeocystis_antarctica.AAC.1
MWHAPRSGPERRWGHLVTVGDWGWGWVERRRGLTVRAIGLAQCPHGGAHDEARPGLLLGEARLHHTVDDLLAHAQPRAARTGAEEGEVCKGLPRL